MLNIFVHKIDKKKINHKNDILSKQEKNKAKKFKNAEDLNLYVSGKYLTRKIISEIFKVGANDIVFKPDNFNRPKLIYPKGKKFDFNLSHSGNVVALAVSDNKVGIDIEKIENIDLKISKDYFHNKEIEFVYSQKGKELENFYKIWTLKEAFVKAIGKGLSFPLKSFHFEIKGDNVKIHPKSKWKGWNLKSYGIFPGYKMAICSKNIIKLKISIHNFK